MHMDSLRRLTLCNNPLEKVELGGFKLLEDLDISEDNIDQIPASIGEMRALRKLDLYNNKITSLPEELFTLTGLSELILAGNPLNADCKRKYDDFLRSKLNEIKIDSL
jgi:Leucine-rich repeat (LRR) protein